MRDALPCSRWTAWAILTGVGLTGAVLAARVVPVVTPARYFEGPLLVLMLAAFASLAAAAGLAAVSVVGLLSGRRAAASLLVASLTVFAAGLVPLDPALHELDDRLHQAAREEIVQRVNAGDLQPPNPPHASLVPLPSEYSWAVSDGGGQRMIEVRPDAGGVRVTFFPHGGYRNRRWAVIYESSDQAPSFPGPNLPTVQRIELVRERWFRAILD